MPAPANLVHQTSVSTGTGNITLAAVNGKRNFATVFGSGATTNVFDYLISNQGAAEWERGTGHMSDATTLVRDTVTLSSNANALVNFSAGTMDVTNDIPATSQIVNPLTTRGDIIVQGATGYQRLALGSSGQILSSDGTDLKWINAAWQLLTSAVIANSATTLDLVLTSYTSFRALRIELYNLMPVNDSNTLNCRFSTNGGSTYDAGSTDYSYNISNMNNGNFDASGNSAGAAQILFNNNTFSTFSNTAGSGGDLELTIYDQTNNAKYQRMMWEGANGNGATPLSNSLAGVAARMLAQDMDAIRFYWTTGNFSASIPGKYAIFGLN